MQEAELNKIQLTILRLLETFITRQYLVFTAMQEIAPDKLYDIPRAMIESEIDGVLRHIPKPRPDYCGSNNEWKVWVHGIGCKLTNVESGEPIEWDAPDTQVFDAYWFSNWLTWHLKNSEPTDATTALLTRHLAETDSDVKTLVFETVNQLLKAGILLDVNARSLNKYKLTTANGM